MALFRNELGNRAARLHPWGMAFARTHGELDEPPANKILERIGAVDPGQSCDRLAAAGDERLLAALHALEVLAEPIVQLAHAYFVLALM